MISSKCNQAHLFVNVSRRRMKSFTDAVLTLSGDSLLQKQLSKRSRLFGVSLSVERVKLEEQGGRVEGGKTLRGNRHIFDLQMRLTRWVPSASSPRCQAKISGSTPEAERKSRVRREEESKCGGKSLDRAGVLCNKKANKPFRYFKGFYFFEKGLISRHVLLSLWNHPPLGAPD